MYGIVTITHNRACGKVAAFYSLARSYLIKDGTSAELADLQAVLLAMDAPVSNCPHVHILHTHKLTRMVWLSGSANGNNSSSKVALFGVKNSGKVLHQTCISECLA